MTGNHRGPVAVVDDDPAMLVAMKALFEAAGYQVGTYLSAMAFLAERTLRPTCLFLDQNMPRMTGLELAAELRAQGMNTPIVLFSGALSPAITACAARIGIQKVLAKPADGEILLSLVAAYS